MQVLVLRPVAGLVLLLMAASGARAQSGDAMGQGQASIAVRSDVKLAVKGTGGTPSARLAKLGQAVGDRMGEIRACYRKEVKSSPEVIGALRLRVSLDQRPKPAIEVVHESQAASSLAQCVTHAVSAGDYRDVGRPAAALLMLDFDNSRARGEAQMQRRKAKLAAVEPTQNPDGSIEASWSTEGDEVRFTVRAERDQTEALDVLLHGFQKGYASFLDCRRKCEKGGISPEGDIHAELTVDRKARARVKLGTISVAHTRAPACANRAFKRVRFGKPTAPLKASVTVHFAP